jgi:hypothetical protein
MAAALAPVLLFPVFPVSAEPLPVLLPPPTLRLLPVPCTQVNKIND